MRFLLRRFDKDFAILISIIIITLFVLPLYRYTDIRYGTFADKGDFAIVNGRVLSSDNYYQRDYGKLTGGYRLTIKYEYHIEGKRFESNKYSFSNVSYSEEKEADVVTDKYERGRVVKVYVSKKNSKVSVLSLENKNSNIFWALLFVFLASIFAVRDYLKRAKVS